MLDVADRPLSPQEVLGHAKQTVPGLGLATVYRTLKSLAEEQWIVPVPLPGQAPHYERAGKAHHHHFHCRGCLGVFEVEGCPGNLKSLAPQGFKVEGHELVLYGVCRDCKGLTGNGA